MPQTSDFVKKLYRMLESPDYQHIVSWGPKGDCFIVKDTNEFTKRVLPKLFKHQNFASFVRQLNKYDFHKIKHSDDDNDEEESWWTFKHPNFRANNKAAMENIKRKSQRTTQGPSTSAHGTSSMTADVQEQEDLRMEVEELRNTVDEMKARMAELEARLATQISHTPSSVSSQTESPAEFFEDLQTTQAQTVPSGHDFYESRPSFTLGPPAEVAESSAAQNQRMAQQSGRQPKVLLVDDDPVARKLSYKFLEKYGCSIDVAIDGVDAVNKINATKYDLVLMDIVMPKLDGLSATTIVRRFDKSTPIMAMTGNSRPDEIVAYCTSGMNDVLSKPFTRKGLYYMLEKYLASPRGREEFPPEINLPTTPTFELNSPGDYLSSNPYTLSSSSLPGNNNNNPSNIMSNFSSIGGDLASVGFGFIDESSSELNDIFMNNPVMEYSSSSSTLPSSSSATQAPTSLQTSDTDLDAMFRSLTSPIEASLPSPMDTGDNDGRLEGELKRKREADGIVFPKREEPDIDATGFKRRRVDMAGSVCI